MRKILFILFLFGTLMLNAQTASDVFSAKELKFFGIDFTMAKFVGPQEYPPNEEIRDVYFRKWNDAYMKGSRRFNLERSYKKKHIYYDTSVYARNDQLPVENLISNTTYSIKRSDIELYVITYADITKTGIGFVYLVESLDAELRYLSVWVAFFNLQTGDILFTEPIRTKANGRNFDYFWTRSFKRMYENSSKDYSNWKKIYKD